MKSSARAARGNPATARHSPVVGWWRHPALGGALLALLLFLPVTQYGFVRDDRELFADNPFMRQPNYLLRLLTTDFWSSTGADSGLWRPLVTLSYWVDGRLGGWLPPLFHGVNLFSHVAVTALLALLMMAAGAGFAATWIATLWFALHPAHVEPVAWISGRTDLWSALFGLLALWLHQRAGETAGWAWRIAGLIAFALALLAKEAAAPLIAVLALLAWRRRSDSPARLTGWLVDVAPAAVLVLVWAVAHFNIAPGSLATTRGWPSPGLAERIWTALAMAPSQLAFLLPGFPHGPDWAIPPARSAADPRVALGFLVHAGAALLLARTWRSRSGAVLAVLMLWLPLLLMSGLVLRGVLLHGERHLYLPSAGAAWLIGIGGWALWRRGLKPTTLPRVVLPVLLGMLLVFNIERSLVQLAGWRTDETMYRAMMRAQPERADGYLGLALVSIGARNDKVALQAIERAEAIDSTRYESATYRAAIASRRANWPEVIRWGRNAIRRGAPESDPWLLEINALQNMKLLPWSRSLVETLMVRHKNDPDVAAAFGRQMLLEDLPARAIKPLEYAVGWNPRDPSLHLLLGDAYARLQRPEKAVEEFNRVVGLQPGNGDAWLRLAAVYHSVGESGMRDDAIRNAASLPGADTTRIRAMYTRMLRGELPARR